MALYCWFEDNKKCSDISEIGYRPLHAPNNAFWWPILKSPPVNNKLIAKNRSLIILEKVRPAQSYIFNQKYPKKAKNLRYFWR